MLTSKVTFLWAKVWLIFIFNKLGYKFPHKLNLYNPGHNPDDIYTTDFDYVNSTVKCKENETILDAAEKKRITITISMS